MKGCACEGAAFFVPAGPAGCPAPVCGLFSSAAGVGPSRTGKRRYGAENSLCAVAARRWLPHKRALAPSELG